MATWIVGWNDQTFIRMYMKDLLRVMKLPDKCGLEAWQAKRLGTSTSRRHGMVSCLARLSPLFIDTTSPFAIDTTSTLHIQISSQVT